MTVICSYCNAHARLIDGTVLYPHRPDLAQLRFWQCSPCDAFVGCHKGGDGTRPLGTLANRPTREARKRAHVAFDPIWQSGKKSRSEAYDWLAAQLGYEFGKCHISWMNEREADRVALVCRPGQKMVSGPAKSYHKVKPIPEFCCPDVPPWELCEHQLNGTAEVLNPELHFEGIELLPEGATEHMRDLK